MVVIWGGMTLPPRPGKRNERFRDLVDLLLLLLLEELGTDYAGLREACEQVFRTRGTHDWPPPLDAVPPHWAARIVVCVGLSAARMAARMAARTCRPWPRALPRIGVS